jgi:hypothetical protein
MRKHVQGMEQVKREAGNEWLTRMRNLYSFVAVLAAMGVVALGPDMSHVSIPEALLVSRQGMLLLGLTLLKLRMEAVLNFICSFLQEVLHFNVVALF